ncbi:pentapeptide repeat-containing protein [Campylobacter majalis]|uniref:pentapeptide repeat-containing protein n=1 Tax=Campylobacter majalis TaxID=2790656 RepID=UPI003D684954
MKEKDRKIQEIADALGIDKEDIDKESFYPIVFTNSEKDKKVDLYIKSKNKKPLNIKEIKDSNILLKYNLTFDNCIFKEGIEISNEEENYEPGGISFNKCVFNKGLCINYIKFNNFTLQECKVKNKIELQNLEIQNFKISRSRFYKNFKFTSCSFGRFQIHTSIFKNGLTMLRNYIQETTFDIDKNVFGEKFKLESTEFNNYFKISNSKFKKGIELKNCSLKENCDFKGNIFCSEVDFSNSKFKNDIFFDNSIFKKTANFKRVHFYQTICFDNVDFKSPPNFSGAYFEKNAIFTNSKFKYTFNDIKSDFKDKTEQDNNSVISDLRTSFAMIKNILNKDGNLLDATNHHKYELYCKELELSDELEVVLNDKKTNTAIKFIKNSKRQRLNITKIFLFLFNMLVFTIMSSVKFIFYTIARTIIFLSLIPIFGIICILYALKIIKNIFCFLFSKQEFTLHKKIKNKLDEINSKNILDLTKWLDYATLHTYRNTSDHHTNFAKILNFTIGMIAVFGIVSLCLIKLNEFLTYQANENFSTYISFMFFGLILFLTSIPNKITQNKKNLIVVLFFTASLFTISATTYASFMSNVAFCILVYIGCILVYYFAFSSKKAILILITRLLAYTAFMGIIIIKPALLNPLFGVFQNENFGTKNLEATFMFMGHDEKEKLDIFLKDKNITVNFNDKKEILNLNRIKLDKLIKTIEKHETKQVTKAIKSDISSRDIMRSLSIIYSIIMLLCIYSLAKTARKSSIIQN